MDEKKKIAIIGTVGIPAIYGGFETLVEYITQNLGNKFDFTVYCSSRSYSIRRSFYNNSRLKYIPLKANGIQSILYDIISLFKAARLNNTILILGVSGCIILPIFKFFFKNKRLIINIDGLEHRREKWGKFAKWFLKYSESLAVKLGDNIITDNKAIKDYVTEEYGVESNFIAYAGDQVRKLHLNDKIIEQYSLPSKYALKVCRIEPENNIQLIIEAFINLDFTLVIIGNWDNNSYGLSLKNKYKDLDNIKLLDPIYNQNILNQIRTNCAIYLHGHSAGGTNPALVEAMNLSLPILTFDCSYNRETTFNKALYFKNSLELTNLINNTTNKFLNKMGRNMYKISKENYTWKKISKEYYFLLK